LRVALIHGLTASVEWWGSTVDALRPHHDVEVLKLPWLPIPDAAEWLASRLAETDEPTAVIGHSSGGTTAVLAALAAPEAVERLVLLAPAGVFATRSRVAFAVPLARQVLHTPSRLPQMLRDTWRVGPWRLWRISSGLLRVDLLPELALVEARTLIVWGADDPLLSPATGKTFEERIPDARLVVLADCGHVPMLEAPEALNRELTEFLA
jgi:pimeloyl-ACP methyl ester carboxylesterase